MAAHRAPALAACVTELGVACCCRILLDGSCSNTVPASTFASIYATINVIARTPLIMVA